MPDSQYRGVTIRLLTAHAARKPYCAELINADGNQFDVTNWYDHPDYALRNAKALVQMHQYVEARDR